MYRDQSFFTISIARPLVLLAALAIVLCLSACGSDDAPVSTKPSATSPAPTTATTQPAATTDLRDLDARTLHDAGLEAFAIGLAGDDVATIMRGVSLLEQATLAAPEMTTYWVDLADGYLASQVPLQYPQAIDILWMLYQEGDVQQDALLARLTEAYVLVGNPQAAFTVAKARLQQAESGHADRAALQLLLLAPGNGRFAETIQALLDKSAQLGGRDYLLLLAATLEELSGNTPAAVKLLDQAIARIDNPELVKYARQAQARMMP